MTDGCAVAVSVAGVVSVGDAVAVAEGMGLGTVVAVGAAVAAGVVDGNRVGVDTSGTGTGAQAVLRKSKRISREISRERIKR